MDSLIALLDVNNIFFTVIGYPISYLEFIGTIFNLATVILAARRSLWNWPIGIVAAILFGILFYQIQLYADFFEQIYYFLTGLGGWYLWQSHRKKSDDKVIHVERNTAKANVLWVTGILMVTVILAVFLQNIHILFPTLFPVAASMVEVDALTTVMSFAATILMIRRKVEAWVLWVAVDVIAVWLYYVKEVPFIALLYLIFLGIATKGLHAWAKAYRKDH